MKPILELLILAFVFTVFTPTLFAVCRSEFVEGVVLDEDIKAEKVPLRTQDNTVKLEAEAISDDGFSVADRALLRGEESHDFKAEINQLMSIIINSLYSNRDIFVRELVSNAADALTKIRFLSLNDDKILGDTPRLEIRIKVDPENKLLHIRDTGIGMTKNELISNLGSVAKSGTKEFLEKMSVGGELETIGQFGVGFYSSFLVADKVTVTSKHNDDEQYIWEGNSEDPSSFSVAKDPRGNTLGRGTLITLHLSEDASEYLNLQKLKDLILRYNEFISYPIFLWTSREEKREVPDEETLEDEEEEEEEDEIDVQEESEESEKKPKTKTITETVWEWQRVNPNAPLWTRRRSDIKEEEYETFFRDVLAGHEAPLDYLHFKAEGDVEFTALLYIPTTLPFGYWDPSFKSQLKLYVKRVFITDNFSDMIPQYFAFIKGILDSDDLPLNVSREMLQENKTLEVIKKKLARKIIGLLQELADDPEKKEKWDKFYEAFSTNLKLGVINDPQNKTRLSKLLYFYSSQNPDEKISLEQYIEKMKKGQKEIFYLGGETLESISASPLLERLTKRGYNVLLLPDPIDEYCISSIGKYDGKFSFQDISKEGLKLGAAEEEKLKEYTTQFEPLTKYLVEVLHGKISKVQVSNRLAKTPAAIVSSSWGYSANMERIMKAQALKDTRFQSPMEGQRIMEINPQHPVIRKLLSMIEEGEQNEETLDVVHILYHTAVLNSGYALPDPKDLTGRVSKLVASSLLIDPLEEVEEEGDEEGGGLDFNEEGEEGEEDDDVDSGFFDELDYEGDNDNDEDEDEVEL